MGWWRWALQSVWPGKDSSTQLWWGFVGASFDHRAPQWLRHPEGWALWAAGGRQGAGTEHLRRSLLLHQCSLCAATALCSHCPQDQGDIRVLPKAGAVLAVPSLNTHCHAGAGGEIPFHSWESWSVRKEPRLLQEGCKGGDDLCRSGGALCGFCLLSLESLEMRSVSSSEKGDEES